MRGGGGRSGIRPSLFSFLCLALVAFLPLPDSAKGAFPGWWAQSLSGQEQAPPAGTVIGRITEQGTGAPQVGAFVALLDPDGERRNAVLTDEAGRYVLRVPAPGRYRLRVEGLGVASTFGELFDFSAGQVREENLQIQAAAVDIAGLEVTGVSQCDLGSDDGSATVRLWDEARKALEVAQWVDEVGYVYEVTTFRRVLSADAAEVFQDERARKTLVGQSPFTSLDAEILMTQGFVIRDREGVSYYGPDAAVLLSDVFLSGHCFGTVREDDRLGLTFGPREGRVLPDIEGTLWFLEEGVLDELEYRYTGVDDYQNASALGGEIAFRRLPQGAWIVQEWAIRMPTAVVEDARGGAPRLVRIRETGALVQEARSIARVDEEVFGASQGALRGRLAVLGVPDAASGQVFLSGTSYRATPGPDGSFLLEGVPPGRYQLVTSHPSLAAMGEGPRSMPVEVVADSVGLVEVLLPTRDEVLTERCQAGAFAALEAPERQEGPIQVVGGVVRTPEGRPAADRLVRVWWRGGGALQRQSGTVVRTNAFGAWVACGVPEGQVIYVDVPEAGLTEAQVEAGVGMGSEEAIQPLGSGARWWVDLVSPSGVPL